ncbi:MAG: hypothetical protein OEW52_13975 [Thermoleophilia bacterium]|nr:hypothetical protein [Thermoleophilia bacterium]MDH4340191.1 hypothetical protein [Thermoleophilia bacterium]MDH5282224.1 hypothetical protein [Thermoleophilia bacterium]
MSRRRLVQVAAILAVPVAIVLAVLAVDVLRLPGKVERGDVLFEAAPRRQKTPWSGIDSLPGWPATRLLDTGDDLAYRRAMARFVRVEPGKVEIYGPRLENLHGKVQLELTEGSASDSNPERRAQFLNLLAAMALGHYSSDPDESANTLRKAIFTLRSAVQIDPGNEDAKLNLELALRSAKAAYLPGTDPTEGSDEGTLSGQGRSGSGY